MIQRLLLFNLVTDADDPILGFTTVWINALARHCSQIDVLTMQAGRLELAPNVRVYSVGKERGYGEARRTIEFYRILGDLLRKNHYDACFAHMQPLFAVMAAPLLKLRRVPITLWYAHKSVTPKLKLAEKWVDHVVTASPESFRLPSRKVIVTGHGIDTNFFVPADAPHDQPFTILSVSRIAPIKKLEILIEAMRRLAAQGQNFRLRIVGGADSQHTAYENWLRHHTVDQGLAQIVEFVGSVPYHQVASIYRTADVMVNLSNTGSIDKAVLEAMSSGLPIITANEAFTPVLQQWSDDLLVEADSPEMLAEKLARLAAQSPEKRRALGCELREIVVRDHSLEHLAKKLVDEIF
jgi:glycosyltransferase involved in cell wall biosynthesis